MDSLDTQTSIARSADTSSRNEIEQVGAVVIGGEHPGLGVARSLGRRGIPVYVIDDQYSISQLSRYVRKFVRVKDLRDEVATVEALLEMGNRYNLKNWVLFPTRDETVSACSRHRTKLAEFYRVTTPPWETVRWAWNKRDTYDLAQKLNIPCPRTFTVKTAEELAGLSRYLPLAMKPAIKENFFYATGAKAWRADTPEQLRRVFENARKYIIADEILLQEIIPGDGIEQYSYCALFQGGAAHGSLVARRLRQHPREFGRAATYVETTEMAEVESLAKRFLTAIDFSGLVEVEFKRDPRDGQFKLLDVNARTWGFHYLGSVVGVDFPYLLFASQMGENLPIVHGRGGVGWIRLITDVPAAISDLLHGTLDISGYLESLKRTRVESVFSLSDPLPSLAEVVLLPYILTRKYLL